MKRLLLFVILALSPVAHAARELPATPIITLNGTPTFLGTITATTTKNNHDTSSPFNNTSDALKGWVLMVQCDAAGYLLPGTTNAAAVTTTNGIKVAADEKYIFIMSVQHGWLAALAVTGTLNCKVWRFV